MSLIGKDKRMLARIRRHDPVTILNFHQISPDEYPFWPPLKPDLFDELLGFLKEHFEIVLFRELSSTRASKPLLILSFDDGYHDFIDYAVPLLKKHDVRANMNIVPVCVESGEPMWNVKMYDFLAAAPKSLINRISLPGFDYRLKDESSNSKIQYGLKISRFLKNRSRAERAELLKNVDGLMRQSNFKLTRMMNRKEIKDIAEEHEIGAHSYSHESMNFEDNAFFETDLQKCVTYFRENLDLQLEIYAFPNGSYRPEQLEILPRYQIKYALLVEEKFANRVDNVFPRFTIYGDTHLETRFRALGIGERATG